ncbi:hypothetical protein MOBT1_002942 [Malassezia obtusa]|uniref:Ribosome biogenesis protein SLX9 n=1 Tax=Malassezia obtusa TaxID=76774 RepID=A0AAF0E393_9BASI|nr:hypothetical protein MOBT1_002942 [Malassezia obtusa]
MARQGAPKREKKKTRSSLASRLTQDKKEGSKGRLGGAIAAPQLSKSALRRQKHRQRDQLAGNQEGLRDLADELTTLEDDIPEHKDEEESVPRTAPGTITAKSKRRMLTRERERQPYILSDLQQSTNPFAALRTHARNTLDLRRAAAPPPVETDEAMSL